MILPGFFFRTLTRAPLQEISKARGFVYGRAGRVNTLQTRTTTGKCDPAEGDPAECAGSRPKRRSTRWRWLFFLLLDRGERLNGHEFFCANGLTDVVGNRGALRHNWLKRGGADFRFYRPADMTLRQTSPIRSLLTAAAFALFGAPAFGQQPDRYCETLKRLVEHTREDFSSLERGAAGPDRRRAAIALPESKSCYISHGKSISFICESKRFKDKAEAVRSRDDMRESALRCLGRFWEKQDQMMEFFIGLNDQENKRSIVFAADSEATPEGAYYVRTQIYRMFQQKLEPEARPAEQTKPAGYCESLKHVVSSASRQFNDLIAGAEKNVIGGRAHWRSNTRLRGWKDCYVHEAGNRPSCRYYSCGTDPVPRREDVQKLTEAVTADVRSCLGETWQQASNKQSDGSVSARVKGPGDGPVVEIRPSKSLYSDAWTLRIDVELDIGCPGDR